MSHHYSGPNLAFPGGDARLDFTDLYAFPKPGDPTKSILIMDVHPSAGLSPPGPTTAEPFAPEALYELKIDTNGDAVADIAYRVRFASDGGGQTATLRRAEGAEAAGTGDGGKIIVQSAPVSMGREARVAEAGEHRFFAGWRSDPFFFDAPGAVNNFQFEGNDFFADKDICSIVLELPNSASWAERGRPVGAHADPSQGRGWGAGSRWIAARDPRKRPSSAAIRTRPIAPGSRRTTRVSSPSSRMRWSIREGMRRRKPSAWQGRCCRISCVTIPRARHPFRAMAGRSPTTSPTSFWLSSRTAR